MSMSLETFLCFCLPVVKYLTGEVGGATPSPQRGGKGGGLFVSLLLSLLVLDLTLPLRPSLLNFGFLSTILAVNVECFNVL